MLVNSCTSENKRFYELLWYHVTTKVPTHCSALVHWTGWYHFTRGLIPCCSQCSRIFNFSKTSHEGVISLWTIIRLSQRSRDTKSIHSVSHRITLPDILPVKHNSSDHIYRTQGNIFSTQGNIFWTPLYIATTIPWLTWRQHRYQTRVLAALVR